MKASFLKNHGGPDVLQFGELPNPVAGPGEAVVRLKTAALNHLDLWVRGGLPGLELKFPHVLGGDGAGVVESVGAGVTGVSVGEEVIVHPGLSCGRCQHCLGGWESLCDSYQILGEHVSGTHAERVKVPERNLFRKPKGMSFEEAAAIPLVFTTAWQMLVRRAKVRPGEWVLVHAAGSGVGSAAIQIAKVHGAKVIATASSQEKLDLAAQLGADVGIDYAQKDFVKEVKLITKEGCDIIVDHLGQDYWPANLRAVRRGGRIAVCGATTGPKASTNLAHVFYRQIQILGSTMGTKGDFPRILSLFSDSKFKAVVDKVFPLEKSKEAFERMSVRGQFGKIVLSI